MRHAILGSAALLGALLVGTTAAAPFDQSLELQGIGFRVQCPNAAPSGGMRQIQYELVAGESGWVLRKDRIVEY